ncbi:uncharacterized protein [Malus domestica]|uniref:uncharacterized protein n=1 Tax=Malus domestica TaxID=3750 RepID=UPI003975C1C9
MEQDQEEPKSTSRTPVFDRMNRSRPRTSALDHIGGQNRTSVFKRLNRPTSRSSIFERLSKPNKQSNTASSPPRQSALERLEDNMKFSGNRETTSKEEKLDRLAGKGDIRSSIPSRMKRQAILEVDANGPLIVRRRTIIHTGQSAYQQTQEDDIKKEVQDVFHITIQEGKEDETLEEDVTAAPPQLEDGGQATVDDLKELNLGTEEEQKPIFVSALLRADEIEEYYQLLSEYKDVFAWTYKEMPGLDPVIAVHHLAVKPGTRPIKQTQRRYRSELIPQIEAEIDKLIEAGFIREVQYPKWISNIVIVLKKSGQIRVCVDFRDLNDAYPKDDFPLPIIEIMVDATTGHEALSFMDGRCQPFSRLMKKDVPFVWDEACHNAFESIKKYLSSPPVLGAPVPGKPLILYMAAQESSVGALLAQENESQKERALYYLSRTLTGAELNYSPIEKMCLALVFAIQKLRHYMHAYTIHLVAKADPVKYVMSKPVLTGRLAKWALLLNQYEIIYVPAKAVKGQALADFLADHPIPADWKISDDLSDEEVFYIDIFPTWTILQMAINMGITALEIFGDSKLIINQLLTEYEVKKDDLIPYFRLATQLLQEFETVTLEHVPRKENQMADALANLASSMTIGEDEAADVPVCQRWVIPLVTEMLLDDTNVISVLPVDVE